jgi:hypothetical protein
MGLIGLCALDGHIAAGLLKGAGMCCFRTATASS